MLNRKILDSKNRYCREVVQNVFGIAWERIHYHIEENSTGMIQRSFRSYLLRKMKD